ncbi:uncharacterized protein LOC126149128 [Schistocerca cancellata]|uniref:uncharacterized protein LOC126149128 n=1 Tax=Schistocerca cancellata TaxID=274614 RepID=UPI0021185174|nr:uncharacterized protein LOC126149128 [Schistocerca cancellata]
MTMWQCVIIGILGLAASSNALSACITQANSNDSVQHDVCPSTPSSSLLLRSDRGFSDQFFDFIDVTLREILRNGTGPLPPLDPLEISNLSLSLGSGSDPLILNLTDIVVENILDYVVFNASYEPVGFRLIVAIDFPDITLNAKYHMKGWLGDGLLYLFGDGDIKLSLVDISLYVGLGLRTVDGIVDVTCVALDYNVGDVKINITGLLGDEELGEIFNLVLEDAIPTLLELAEDPLLGKVTCLLKETANDLFQKNQITLNQLLCKAGITLFCLGGK